MKVLLVAVFGVLLAVSCALHHKIRVFNDGSVRSDGLGDSRFKRVCTRNDVCTYSIHAPANNKTQLSSFQTNITSANTAAQNEQTKMNSFNSTWQTYNETVWSQKVKDLTDVMEQVREGIANITMLLDAAENGLTVGNQNYGKIQQRINSMPACYANVLAECAKTTTGPTSGPNPEGSTNAAETTPIAPVTGAPGTEVPVSGGTDNPGTDEPVTQGPSEHDSTPGGTSNPGGETDAPVTGNPHSDTTPTTEAVDSGSTDTPPTEGSGGF